MDILVSSNLERLLYYLSGKDNERVREYMEGLNASGRYEITGEMGERLREDFYGGCVYMEEAQKTIRKVFEEQGYLLDTHTAVAYKSLEDYKIDTGDESVSVVLATASPFKFAGSVYEALYGRTKDDEFAIMEELSQKTGVKIPENLSEIKNKKIRHFETCAVDEMEAFVTKASNKSINEVKNG